MSNKNRFYRNCGNGQQRIGLVEVLNKKDDRAHPDLTTYLDDCNQLILSSALRVGKDVHSVSIGPRRCIDGVEIKRPVSNERIQGTFTSSTTPNALHHTKETGRTSQKTKNVKCPPVSTEPDVTVTTILVKIEKKRRKDLQETMRLHREQIISSRKEQLEKEAAEFKAILEKQSAAKALQVQEELRELREEELLRAAERKQQLELEQQLHAEKLFKRAEQIREAEQRKKEILLLRKMIDEIQKYYQEYCQNYRGIHSAIMSCKDKVALKAVIDGQRSSSEIWPILLQRCKDNQIGLEDVKSAKDSVVHIKTLLVRIKEEVDKIHKKIDQKLDEEKKQGVPSTLDIVSESNGTPQVVKTSASSLSSNNTSTENLDFVDNASLRTYQEIRDFKQANEKLFEQLLKDNSLKKFRSDCQKAVNVPVNAISHSSASHLHDKLKKLSMLLSGQPVMISDGVRVSASMHPAGIPFCKDLLAKKFVRQGALTVSSKPEAAFPIAAIMIALWQEFPDWGRLVLAHFYEECPYLVPAFWPQLEGQSNTDYYKSLGYHYSADGEVEKQDKFLKRMSGIMRLYAALLISRLPRERQHKPHPHDLSQGWRWLASLLNLEPRPGICATVIYDFLEVAGNSMFQLYGRQFQKLLFLICKEYYPRLRKVSECSGGPVVRLELLMEQTLKQGSIEAPQGMLPPNFW